LKYDQFPKSVTKAIRYIKQESTNENLKEIEKAIKHAIELRKKKIV
jgi:hypothetical protein